MTTGLRFRDTSTMSDGMRQAVERSLSRIAATPAPVEKGDARRKYRNKPTTVDGIRFDSKHEARRFQVLQLMQKTGEVRWFTRQVPFWLEGGVKFVVDWLVVYADERGVQLEDTKSKGTMTQVYINKKKQLRARYGLEVSEV